MEQDRIFEALASLTRREILAMVAQRALTTSELAARFAVSPPAISRHLSLLEAAGLVAAERQGQRVLYRLNRDVLLAALAALASAVDGPLRRPQSLRAPREAI
jgi:DNA-binding transcriptional ArsR family regulator